MKLAGCASVVTGGASGLGEATARALAAEDVKVAIFDRDESKGPAVAESIGGVFCKVDVTNEEQVASIFDTAVERFGRVDLLVSNAGVLIAQPFSVTFSDTPSTLMVRSSLPIPQKGLGTSVISVIQLSFRYS